jgi:hypothetical protein
MKVVNTIKLKEEVDFEILYKKMEHEVDHLTSEVERQQNLRQSEKMLQDKKLEESEMSLHDLKKTSSMRIEVPFFHVSALWSTALFSIYEFPTVLQHCIFLK